MGWGCVTVTVLTTVSVGIVYVTTSSCVNVRVATVSPPVWATAIPIPAMNSSTNAKGARFASQSG